LTPKLLPFVEKFVQHSATEIANAGFTRDLKHDRVLGETPNYEFQKNRAEQVDPTCHCKQRHD
jgi:hypothetical protein